MYMYTCMKTNKSFDSSDGHMLNFSFVVEYLIMNYLIDYKINDLLNVLWCFCGPKALNILIEFLLSYFKKT